MKTCKYLSLFLALIFILGTVSLGLVSCSNNSDFTPVLRFAVASDVHIKDSGSDAEEAQLEKLFEVSYRHSRSIGSSYKALDAVIFAGDFTDLGTLTSMNKFKSIVDDNLKSETQALVSLGNHEFFTDPQNTEERYKSVFNTEVDEHLVIQGFHFIKLSPNGESFSEEKLRWLSEELEKAALDTPDLPIFVVQHQHVKGTVYGSTGWGVDGLYDILSKYPQVVDFSGHSHFPIQDERSLWQGDFTAIGTGTLSYIEMGLNGVSSDYVFPHGKHGDYELWKRTGDSDYAVFQIVECDKNGNIRLTGYDLISDTVLFEKRIDSPSDKSCFITNETKAVTTSVPEFSEGSACQINESENGEILLAIPQALSDAYIESYRAEVYSDGKLIKTYYALSGQIFTPHPETIHIRITGLEKGREYTVRIYAVNAYGVAGKKPLELTIP